MRENLKGFLTARPSVKEQVNDLFGISSLETSIKIRTHEADIDRLLSHKIAKDSRARIMTDEFRQNIRAKIDKDMQVPRL